MIEKRGFMGYGHFLWTFHGLRTSGIFWSMYSISTRSLSTYNPAWLIGQLLSSTQIICFWKICTVCKFAVMLTFILPLEHEVDEMSVTHVNQIWINLLVAISFIFYVFTVTQKLPKVICHIKYIKCLAYKMWLKIRKRQAEVSVTHIMFAQWLFISEVTNMGSLLHRYTMKCFPSQGPARWAW